MNFRKIIDDFVKLFIFILTSVFIMQCCLVSLTIPMMASAGVMLCVSDLVFHISPASFPSLLHCIILSDSGLSVVSALSSASEG